MNNLLILGGTGFVGRALCEQWIRRTGAAGGRVTVLSRHAQRAKAIQLLPTVEVVQASMKDPKKWARWVAGRDAVVNMIGILHGSERDFQQVHVDLVAQLTQACQQAGVRRVVHVSALGAGDNAPSKYLRSKAAGEKALKQADLDWTILRPSVIFGAEDRFMNLFAQLQKVFPVVPLACSQARFQPVWVDDVAQAIVRVVDMPHLGGKTFECAGPSVYTLAELVRLAGRWSGHERPVLPLPEWLGRLQAAVLGLLPGEPLISCDNLDSMRIPNVASGKLPGLDALGINATALESIAPLWLGHQGGPARLEPWRQLAGRG